MVQLPASVTIVQLPAGTTVVGTELIEAVQTSNNQANSVKLTVNQIIAAAGGGTPTGGTSLPLLAQGTGNTSIFGILPVIGGGTNTSTLTPFGVTFGNGSSTIGITAAGGTALAVISPGPLTSPVFGQISLTAAVTGVLPVPNGGVGTSTLTPFGVLYGATPIGVTAPGNTALVLISPGPFSQPPFFGTVSLTAAVNGVLLVSNGGVGTSTLTQNGVAFGNGTAALGITAAGNTGLILLSPGPLTSPVFGQVSLTAAVTGVLGVPNGGSGTSTLTQNGILFGNAAGTVGITTAGNTALALLSPGPLANPSFGVLTVPGGGSGTTTLTAHAVLLGEAAATLGFATIGTGGRVLIDQGAGNDPVFLAPNTDLTMGTSGTATVIGLQGRILVSTAPMTSQVLQWNGTVWLPASGGAGSVTSVGTGWGITGGPITLSGTASIATTNPPYGFDTAVNLQINASTSGSALTLAIKGNNGSDPSATNPVLFPFRDATLANGDPVWRTATAALSVTITQTATLGGASASPMRGWITAHDTGTTPTIGVINCVVGMPTPTQVVPLATNTLQTTTAIGSTAVTAGVFYSAVGVNNRPFMILGYFEYNNVTTAGQWINTPTVIQLFGPGIKKPGDIIQTIYSNTIASVAITTTTFTNTFLSATITPTSVANLVSAVANGSIFASSFASAVAVGVFRNTVILGVPLAVSAATSNGIPITVGCIDAPTTTSSTTYIVKFSVNAGGTYTFPYVVSSGGQTTGATMTLNEIMG